jgi:hypothetical protein
MSGLDMSTKIEYHAPLQGEGSGGAWQMLTKNEYLEKLQAGVVSAGAGGSGKDLGY